MPFKELDVNDVYKNDVNMKKDDVGTLLEWVSLQPHLPKITELQAALFLHSCYYRMELAKTTIDLYFTVKSLCPDIFGNRIPSDRALQQSMNCVLLYPLPKKTASGDTVIFGKLSDPNPEFFNYGNAVKCFDMITTLHLHQDGPDNGVIILFDMKNVVFGHVLKLSVIIMKKFLYYLQEGMPIRLKNMQYFNIVPLMDKILALMKPFMKKELFDSILLHNDMESLFKHIPQDILPQDYGGSCDSLDILVEKYKGLMNANADFFKFQDSQVVDESKRPGKPKDISEIFGMDGTFRKLEVD